MRAAVWETPGKLAVTEAPDLVYNLQRSSDGLIKIGTSRTLVSRFAALRRDYGPLLLMATHRGAHKEEHTIHDYFAALRTEGEWVPPGRGTARAHPEGAVGGRTPEGLPEQIDLSSSAGRSANSNGRFAGCGPCCGQA